MSNDPFAINTDNKVAIPAAKNKAGFAATQEPHEYINQVLFKLAADHVWGTQAQALTDDVTFYTDGSGNPLDKSAVAVPIAADDKILIGHDAAASANLLLDAGGVKITLEMLTGVTLSMGAFDLTLGGSGDSVGGDIRLTQTGTLTINGNRGLRINNSVDVYEDFKTKNLIINVQSNTTVDADADNIIMIDSFGNGKRVDSINETFDITTDLMSGTSEKASRWYQLWLDSAGVRLMVPDLEGTTDSTTASKLEDSTADFVTDKVSIGDIVYNLTDLTQTTVTAIDDLDTLSVADDIFVSGEDYKIRALSPSGLGEFRARIGAAFNNGSSNLDDSTYTQIQEEKFYSEAAGDFTVTGTNWTTTGADIRVSQVKDWTGKGFWQIKSNIFGTLSSTTTTSFTGDISGLLFGTTTQAILTLMSDGASVWIQTERSITTISTGNFSVNSDGAVAYDRIRMAITAMLSKKPTFHN